MNKIFILILSLFFTQTILAEDFLLKPSGKYDVGFQDFRFVNGDLINGSYSCPGKTSLYLGLPGVSSISFGIDNQIDFCNEMMIRVYYPIQSTQGLPYANYYRPSVTDLQNKIIAANVPGISKEDIDKLSNIQTFTINFTDRNSNIVNAKFPVLIFSPGWTDQAQDHENILSNMASHGYIVIALNSAFLANVQFPSGLIPYIPLDPFASYSPSNLSGASIAELSILNNILFIKQVLLDPNKNFFPAFIDHMELNQVGVFGHSISGYPIVRIVRENPNLFQAASYLDIDPVQFGTLTFSPAELSGFDMPFLRFHAAEWYNPYFREFHSYPSDMQFQLLSNNYFSVLSPNTNDYIHSAHLSFTDFETLQYQSTIKAYFEKLNSAPPIYTDFTQLGVGNGFYIASVINDYLLSFFDQYLKNIPSQNLNACISIASDTMLSCKKTL